MENKSYDEMVRLLDALLPPDKPTTMHRLSSILKRTGFRVGTPRLWQWMWDNGFVIPGTQRPTPTAMAQGLFITLSIVTDDGASAPILKNVTKVTRKGVELFIKMLLYPNAG